MLPPFPDLAWTCKIISRRGSRLYCTVCNPGSGVDENGVVPPGVPLATSVDVRDSVAHRVINSRMMRRSGTDSPYRSTPDLGCQPVQGAASRLPHTGDT